VLRPLGAQVGESLDETKRTLRLHCLISESGGLRSLDKELTDVEPPEIGVSPT
jgi:hypothetical protein